MKKANLSLQIDDDNVTPQKKQGGLEISHPTLNSDSQDCQMMMRGEPNAKANTDYSEEQKASSASYNNYTAEQSHDNLPLVIIEGPEPSQDLSYKWVMKYCNVQEIEKGVPLNEFQDSVECRELEAEFKLLRKLTETKEHLDNQEQIQKQRSKQLNRYSDLKPFKHTRVRLPQRNEDIYDSYINANFVSTSYGRGGPDKLFICTQGPMQATIENFWRMVDTEKVQLIVMLTGTKENGKMKCDQYWPADVEEGIQFDQNRIVQLQSVETIVQNLVKRTFLISSLNGQQSMIVTHLQYLAWPDHGAPELDCYQSIAYILDQMTSFHERITEQGNQGKIVVHCSAGIGRTGSLIAIYNLQLTVMTLLDLQNQNKNQGASTSAGQQQQVNNVQQNEPTLSVFGVVRRLREQRYCMVQATSQYEFIYEYILQWLKSKGLDQKD